MTTTERRRQARSLVDSARARILLAVVGLLVFAAAISTFLLRQALLERSSQRVDDALIQETQELRRLARDGRNPETGRPFGDDIRSMFDVYLARNVPAAGEQIYTFVRGRPYRSTRGAPLPPEVLDRLEALGEVPESRSGDIEAAGHRIRYAAVPVAAGDAAGVFLVTFDVAAERQDVADAVRIAGIVSGVALLLATVIGALVAGRVLRPLRDITDAARAITETDLTRRIPVEGKGELAELGRTFNAMLDRLEQAFASQRALVSDAGHELRTPITIIRGHLELIGDDPAERRETMALVSDELDRMARLVDDLLLLAKSQRTDFLLTEPIDVDDLTEELLSKARHLGDRDWRLEQAATARLVADRQRLTQAMINLAMNAVQHTAAGERIFLGSAQENGHVRLWVRDTGPGVPAGQRERIFERFVRGPEAAPGEGSGLGLAITRAIAEAHGGNVDVDNWARDGGRGAIFTVTLPLEPRP